MKVVVVGAGASGLISAGRAASLGNDVIVIEKNEKIGKKIYITGKGRCNLTNTSDDFLDSIVHNSKFLYSALDNFDVKNTIDFFNNLGLKTKVERGNRVFPESDKSNDVIKALEKYCDNNNVKINLNEEVQDISKCDNIFTIKTTKSIYKCDVVIISTGGMSYPLTGSTGSGYSLLKKFGHTIVSLLPALCPIKLKDSFVSQWQGISLKNVSLIAMFNKKIFKSFFGEMLFTNDGISGPIALTMSSYINQNKNIDLFIDFKPALSLEQLDKRLIREIDDNKNVTMKNLMKKLLPSNMSEEFLKVCNVSSETKANCLSKNDRKVIIQNLKSFPLTFNGLYPLENAIVTCGGVSCKEINPKTMESKIVKNLYVTGELLDLDALTGGYNLQIAWSTGYLAGSSIGE